MTVDVIIEDNRWGALDLPGLASDCTAATFARLGIEFLPLEVSILACDDTRIAALNGGFRDAPVPTNVLSWPSEERGAKSDGDLPVTPVDPELGDIAISYDTCTKEAVAQGKAFSDHVGHLLVHATLHLLGYDHTRPKDAEMMEALEVEILARLGIADPY